MTNAVCHGDSPFTGGKAWTVTLEGNGTDRDFPFHTFAWDGDEPPALDEVVEHLTDDAWYTDEHRNRDDLADFLYRECGIEPPSEAYRTADDILLNTASLSAVCPDWRDYR